MGSIQTLLSNAVGLFITVLEWLIFIRIILSWFPMGQGNPISQMLFTLTEPILGPVRAMVDKSPLGGGMMLDFSPVFALFLIRLGGNVLQSLIAML